MLRQSEMVYAVLSSGLHMGPNDFGVAMSPDGRSAFGIQNDQLVLMDTATGAEIRRFDKVHSGGVTSVAVSRDGRTALTASDDTTLIYWDLTTGTPIRRLSGHTGAILAVAFTSDDRQAVTASTDLTVRLWDLDSAGEVQRLRAPGFDRAIAVVVSPDGTENAVIWWDLATGTEIRRLEGFGVGAAFGVQASVGTVYDVTFGPDGHTAYTASMDRTLCEWDLDTGEELHRYDMTQSPLSVALLPDGAKIVVYSTMFYTHILDRETWTLQRCIGTRSGAGGMWDVVSDGRTRCWATTSWASASWTSRAAGRSTGWMRTPQWSTRS